MDVRTKLEILAASAKYDVACSSSGSRRVVSGKGLGSTRIAGCCHSWSEDGRCISLLKILFSNSCVYDCAFCAIRRSNDFPRATFTVDEIVNLTLGFYRCNYIEGLFLSSGIHQGPDATMEQLVMVAERLRRRHRFGGYIHLKGIPGANADLIRRAGLVADRLSVNIELPSERALQELAPDKNREGILAPMRLIGETIADNRRERKKTRKAPVFAPAGQSTQLIVGASPENDFQILRLCESLYERYRLKRVYYSAYIPVNKDSRLPALYEPPRLREHRLYQADWLLRFYGFSAEEIVSSDHPHLEEGFDPKTAWALRNPGFFPVEINRADYECLLRVPGIGVRSAKRIVTARRYGSLDFEDLSRIGVVLKRARFFITCRGKSSVPLLSQDPYHYRKTAESLRSPDNHGQLRLF